MNPLFDDGNRLSFVSDTVLRRFNRNGHRAGG